MLTRQHPAGLTSVVDILTHHLHLFYTNWLLTQESGPTYIATYIVLNLGRSLLTHGDSLQKLRLCPGRAWQWRNVTETIPFLFHGVTERNRYAQRSERTLRVPRALQQVKMGTQVNKTSRCVGTRDSSQTDASRRGRRVWSDGMTRSSRSQALCLRAKSPKLYEREFKVEFYGSSETCPFYFWHSRDCGTHSQYQLPFLLASDVLLMILLFNSAHLPYQGAPWRPWPLSRRT